MRIFILALIGINTLALASLAPRERLQSEMDFLRKEAFKEGIKEDLMEGQSGTQSTELALEDQYFSDSVSTGLAAPAAPEKEEKNKKFKTRGR